MGKSRKNIEVEPDDISVDVDDLNEDSNESNANESNNHNNNDDNDSSITHNNTPSTPINNPIIRRMTKNEILDETTKEYISNLNLDDLPSPEEAAAELLTMIEEKISEQNDIRKGHKLRIPETLSFSQIAQLMAYMYPIACICCANNADEEYDLLALYMEDGPNKGVYTPSETQLYRLARRFNSQMTSAEFKETLMVLRSLVPRKTRCMDRDLIAVNNGIFNYETKILEPFSPDYVFMTKSHVNYNPSATNITIHNDTDNTDWDIESWMADLSDDPEIVELLWQILGAIIRPFVRWNKSAWLYSESGNNGKGTLCELMRSLCGENAYASIPICDFSKDFALEPLTRSTAIIVDENDVGTYVDRAANLKAIITNDVISINRKFKVPISYQFYGFMVQCLNEFPRIKDKSDSFYRRQLFIPFDKCFTGRERKYIKNDYLHRNEVLEYVLYKVLHDMNYYTLLEPQACVSVLSEYKEFNDPVRQYFEEFETQWVWDLLPFGFLYDHYKSWFKDNTPQGKVEGKQKFILQLVNISSSSHHWYCMDKQKTLRTGNKMDKPEPIIATYKLDNWKNPTYMGGDIDKICMPKKASYYRGLLRFGTSDDDTNDDGGDINENID